MTCDACSFIPIVNPDCTIFFTESFLQIPIFIMLYASYWLFVIRKSINRVNLSFCAYEVSNRFLITRKWNHSSECGRVGQSHLQKPETGYHRHPWGHQQKDVCRKPTTTHESRRCCRLETQFYLISFTFHDSGNPRYSNLDTGKVGHRHVTYDGLPRLGTQWVKSKPYYTVPCHVFFL